MLNTLILNTLTHIVASQVEPLAEPNLYSYERNGVLSFPQERYKRDTIDLREVEAPVFCRYFVWQKEHTK